LSNQCHYDKLNYVKIVTSTKHTIYITIGIKLMKINALQESVRALGQDAAYMSDQMVAVFKSAIEKELPLTSDRLTELEDAYRERNTERHVDPLDKAQQQTAQTDTMFEINSTKNRYQKLRYALRLIEIGDYGFCIDCGDDIGIGRMSTDTTHSRDASCATRYEQKQKQRTGFSRV
jgi:DnaK suppressor protein